MCDNDEFYGLANFQPEIVCIPIYKKWLIPVNVKSFKFGIVHELRSRNLSFLHTSKYKIFSIGFLKYR